MNLKLIIAISGASLLFGCASPMKADLASTDSKKAIEEVKTLQGELADSNIDVLADKAYIDGVSDFRTAISYKKKKGSEEKVMSSLGQAKAHFLEAQKTAESRTALPKRILLARSGAVKAGANNFYKKELRSADKSLISKTGKFSEDLSVSELSEFQSLYLGLEGNAVRRKTLGAYYKIIKEAKKNDASNLAPKTYKAARADVGIAGNQIKYSPRDPDQYSKSVEKANKSAKLLNDVMNKLQDEAKGASEKVALKLVYQERKLGKLSDKVDTLKGSLGASQTALDESQTALGASQTALGSASEDLRNKEAQIMSAKSKIKFQTAMNQVRESFAEDEASVYQQGQKLIIRLKKVNFKSGKSTVPEDSKDLLSKVSSIVSEVGPEAVTIEGHTDSMGKQNYNMMLSTKRAAAVKAYFMSLNVKYSIEALGFGESKPIANNETKDGRSLNRRVDIIVKVVQ